MNPKPQISSNQTINLNQIIDDEEFKKLLNQEFSQLAFQSHFLNDLTQKSLSNKSFFSHSQMQLPSKKQTYDSQAVRRQRKLMEQAYERKMQKSGKLLSNKLFNQGENETQTYYDSLNQENDDYFSQYIKWKDQKYQNLASKLSSGSNILPNHKKVLESIKTDSQFALNHRNFKGIPSSNYSDDLQRQMRKIHQQYMEKVTKTTSKNIFPHQIDLKDIEEKVSIHPQTQRMQKDIQTSQKSFYRVNSSKLTQICSEESRPEEKNIQFKHKNEKKTPKFDQSYINEYCFQNMIKRKPDFEIFKQINHKKNQSYQEKPQKITPKEIKQDFLWNATESSASSILSQSNLTQKSTSQHQNSYKDPYYKELKQMIQKKQIQQTKFTNKEIYNKQVPTNQPSKPSPVVRLNVQKLLKLPYKDFIVFFDENHRKIVSMTQPDEYKRLQAYQKKCLEHVESIEKLRERFSSEQGARLIGRLSVNQKQKLFKVLYEKQA